MAIKFPEVAEKTEKNSRPERKFNWFRFVLLLGTVSISFLATYNLSYNPAPWFDEGEILRVPKTLVQYGQYASWSADGFFYFGTTVSVGPALLLPVALVFKLFGIGLLQARLLIVTFLVVALALYARYSYKLWQSKFLTILGLLLLTLLPGANLIMLGRQGLGEVPALAFFLAGLLAWYKANARLVPSWGWVTLSGFCFTLATITKSNYGLILPLCFFITWLINRYYYRFVYWNWKVFALPGLMVVSGLVSWYLAVLLFLGSGDLAANFSLLRTATGGSAFVFSAGRSFEALKFLFGPQNLFGLGIAGLIYGLWLLRKPTENNRQLLLPLVFSLVWLGWFAFTSIGWPRYAFPALVIYPLFTVRLLADIPSLIVRFFGKKVWAQPAKWLVAVVMTCLLGLYSFQLTTNIFYYDSNAAQMNRYLDQNISKSAVIETWEPEMAFLTNHLYHFPPQELLDKAVRRKWLGNSSAPLQEYYQLEKLKPDYLLDGKFARWNELYSASFIAANYQLLVTFGDYKLYQRIK